MTDIDLAGAPVEELYETWERELLQIVREPDVALIASIELEAERRGVDLQNVLTAMTAAPFDPSLHPRGKDGMFIEIFGLIKLIGYSVNGKDGMKSYDGRRGKVMAIIPHPKDKDKDPTIRVALLDKDGKPSFVLNDVKPSQVLQAPEKARLDAPDADAPSAPKVDRPSDFADKIAAGKLVETQDGIIGVKSGIIPMNSDDNDTDQPMIGIRDQDTDEMLTTVGVNDKLYTDLDKADAPDAPEKFGPNNLPPGFGGGDDGPSGDEGSGGPSDARKFQDAALGLDAAKSEGRPYTDADAVADGYLDANEAARDAELNGWGDGVEFETGSSGDSPSPDDVNNASRSELKSMADELGVEFVDTPRQPGEIQEEYDSSPVLDAVRNRVKEKLAFDAIGETSDNMTPIDRSKVVKEWESSYDGGDMSSGPDFQQTGVDGRDELATGSDISSAINKWYDSGSVVDGTDAANLMIGRGKERGDSDEQIASDIGDEFGDAVSEFDISDAFKWNVENPAGDIPADQDPELIAEAQAVNDRKALSIAPDDTVVTRGATATFVEHPSLPDGVDFMYRDEDGWTRRDKNVMGDGDRTPVTDEYLLDELDTALVNDGSGSAPGATSTSVDPSSLDKIAPPADFIAPSNMSNDFVEYPKGSGDYFMVSPFNDGERFELQAYNPKPGQKNAWLDEIDANDVAMIDQTVAPSGKGNLEKPETWENYSDEQFGQMMDMFNANNVWLNLDPDTSFAVLQEWNKRGQPGKAGAKEKTPDAAPDIPASTTNAPSAANGWMPTAKKGDVVPISELPVGSKVLDSSGDRRVVLTPIVIDGGDPNNPDDYRFRYMDVGGQSDWVQGDTTFPVDNIVDSGTKPINKIGQKYLVLKNAPAADVPEPEPQAVPDAQVTGPDSGFPGSSVKLLDGGDATPGSKVVNIKDGKTYTIEGVYNSASLKEDTYVRLRDEDGKLSYKSKRSLKANSADAPAAEPSAPEASAPSAPSGDARSSALKQLDTLDILNTDTDAPKMMQILEGLDDATLQSIIDAPQGGPDPDAGVWVKATDRDVSKSILAKRAGTPNPGTPDWLPKNYSAPEATAVIDEYIRDSENQGYSVDLDTAARWLTAFKTMRKTGQPQKFTRTYGGTEWVFPGETTWQTKLDYEVDFPADAIAAYLGSPIV